MKYQELTYWNGWHDLMIKEEKNLIPKKKGR